ncbi:MAG TPA: type II toxin-antitoxin system RelE/ParE family toxin [Longimicrobium sp.]|nr:type II toxin-antitoxin system RelE/ParE family toxin [Longimicrobium sp.]
MKPVIWVHGEVKSPPFSPDARKRTGNALLGVQKGEMPTFPLSRPMPSIGRNCHELRIPDARKTWRVIYSIHAEAIYVLEVFRKTTRQTPQHVVEGCRERLRRIEQSEWRAKHG